MSFEELADFIEFPNPDISKVALENILPVTIASAGKSFLFKENDFKVTRALKRLSLQSQDTWTTQNALIALINITEDDAIRSELANDSKFVVGIIKLATTTPKPSFLKYVFMLLNNLSKNEDTLKSLRGPALAAVTILASKPQNISDEDYDFWSFVLSEFARQDAMVVAKLIPYLYAQLQSDSVNRRRGVASTIKNSLFDVNVHEPLGTDTPLIEAIMNRLKGPEPLDDEDFAQLPPSVQKEYSSNKKRESDNSVLLLLLESLLLLSSSKTGRDSLRQKNAYFVVRELHNSSSDPNISAACESYANMILRGEPSETKSNAEKASEASGDADEDEGIEEVI